MLCSPDSNQTPPQQQANHCGLDLNQVKSKCRALGPMYRKNRHKTMMIPGKTKIFQWGLFEKIRFENFQFSPPRSCRIIMTRKANIIYFKF